MFWVYSFWSILISFSLNRRIFSLMTMKVQLAFMTLWVFSFMVLFNKIIIFSSYIAITDTLLLIIIMFFFSRKRITFYMLFEVRLVPTLMIVLFYGYQPEKLSASKYLLLYTVTSSLPMLFIFLNNRRYMQFIISSDTVWFSLFITFGFIVKTPIYLVHVWLPKAHVEAPIAGSIALAGVLLKMGRYGLLVFCPSQVRPVLVGYLSLRVWGSIYCRLSCLRSWDIKSLIAYRSVVHIGVTTNRLVMGSEIGYIAALIIAIGHGFCSPILFAMAHIVYCSSHRRTIFNNKGILRVPLLSMVMFLLLTINMGVPPSLTFFRELLMMVTLIRKLEFLAILSIVVFFLRALYNLMLFVSLRQSKEKRDNIVIYLIWPIFSSLFYSIGLIISISFF